jgi:phenylacetyl-CoA:acceptor oxidoreductase
VVVDADQARRSLTEVEGTTAYQMLVQHVAGYTPEWASSISRRAGGHDPAHRRRIPRGGLCIGATIEIDGHTLPLRPVAVTLGKSVNNGWGAYECCWARTVLAALVGALENPGGLLGTTVRLNRPQDNRHLSVLPGEDGFMVQHFNPTDAEHWQSAPATRNLHQTLVPIVGHNGAWSQALGPTQLAWMFQQERPADWNMPTPTFPDLWIVFRSNPAISFWDTRRLADLVARFPYLVCLRLHDRRNQLHGRPAVAGGHGPRIDAADPHGRHQIHGAVLGPQGRGIAPEGREPQGEARDFTWIAPNWPNAPVCSRPTWPRSTAACPALRRSRARATTFASPDAANLRPTDLGRGLPCRHRFRFRPARTNTASTGSRSTAFMRCRCRAWSGT